MNAWLKGSPVHQSALVIKRNYFTAVLKALDRNRGPNTQIASIKPLMTQELWNPQECSKIIKNFIQ